MSYDFDLDLVNRQRAANRKREKADRQWQEQHDRERERELRGMEYERNKKKKEKKKKFIEKCLASIHTDNSEESPTLLDRGNKGELINAMEYLYDTAFNSWVRHHGREGRSSHEAFRNAFMDMLIGNLRHNGWNIIQELRSSDSRRLFKENRDNMNAEGTKMAKDKFYGWRNAYIADIIYHTAIGNILDHLGIAKKSQLPIKFVLRAGGLKEQLSEGENNGENLYLNGEPIIPKRRFLIHNHDIIEAINHFHSQIEGGIIPKPLHPNSRLGKKKRVLYMGHATLDDFT